MSDTVMTLHIVLSLLCASCPTAVLLLSLRLQMSDTVMTLHIVLSLLCASCPTAVPLLSLRLQMNVLLNGCLPATAALYVYSAVRTASLYIIQVTLVCKRSDRDCRHTADRTNV